MLAEKLGVSASTAGRWHAAVGGDGAVYLRLLAEDDGDEHRHQQRLDPWKVGGK